MGGASIVAQNSVSRTDIGAATAGSMLTKQFGGAVSLACGQCSAPTSPGGVAMVLGWIGGLGGLLALVSVGLMPELRIGDRTD